MKSMKKGGASKKAAGGGKVAGKMKRTTAEKSGPPKSKGKSGNNKKAPARTQKVSADFDDDEDSIDEESGVFDADDDKKYGDTVDAIFARNNKVYKAKGAGGGSKGKRKPQATDFSDDEGSAADDDFAGGHDVLSMMEAREAKTNASKQMKKKPKLDLSLGGGGGGGSFGDAGDGQSDASSDGEGDEHAEHASLLHSVTAMAAAGKDKQATSKPASRLAAVDENVAHLIDDDDDANAVTLDDLLTPLQRGESGGESRGTVQRQLLKLDASKEMNGAGEDELLGDVKQARKERTLNYDVSKKDARKWDIQVRNNRNARQILYGDYEDTLENRSTRSLAASFQFKTAANSLAPESVDSFEEEIAKALAETKALEAEQRAAGVQDQLGGADSATANPQIREAKRTQQLGHLRALQLRELTRAKRLKKIKSKSFHRVKKRMDMKEKEKVLARLEQEDPELAAQIKREMEEKLAQTRSRRGAEARKKWARMANRFGGKEMRGVISTEAQKAEDQKRALKRALKGKDGDRDSDSEDSDLDLSDEELDPLEKAEMLAKKELEESFKMQEGEEGDAGKSAKAKGLFGLKFMQEALTKKRDESQKQAAALLGELEKWKSGGKKGDSDSEEAGEEKVGSDSDEGEDEETAFTKEELAVAEEELARGAAAATPNANEAGSAKTSRGKKRSKKSAGGGLQPQQHETAAIDLAADQDRTGSSANAPQAAEHGATPSTTTAARARKSTAATTATPAAGSSTAASTGPGADESDNEQEDSSSDEGEVADPFAQVDAADDQNAELIKSAFAQFSDDNQRDFDGEINQNLQSKQEKLEQAANKMSGWGSWAGEGVVESRRKPKATITTLMQPKTACNAKVTVLNNGKPSAAFSDKYEVRNMPHPFHSKEQYETALGQAVGSEWNTGAVHKYKIQPQVVTRLGAVVQPLRHIKHARSNEERDEMLAAWSKNHKPKKPKARF